MKKVIVFILMILGYVCLFIGIIGSFTQLVYGKFHPIWSTVGALIWLLPGWLCIKGGKKLKAKFYD